MERFVEAQVTAKVEPPQPTNGEPVRFVVGANELTTLDGATVRAKVGLPLGAVIVGVPIDDGFEIVGIERPAPQKLSPMLKALLRKRELLTARMERWCLRMEEAQQWVSAAESEDEMATRMYLLDDCKFQVNQVLEEVRAYNDTASEAGLPLVRPPDTVVVSAP